METVGDELRKLLVASGMGVRELARASGVSAPTVCRFLKGKRTLAVPHLEALARACGVVVVLKRKAVR
ncbi:MAG: helix-turn-helix domain-containing protein [Tepidisphaerales bacterium]